MTSPAANVITELRALAGVGEVDNFVLAPHQFRVRYIHNDGELLEFSAPYDAVARADHDALVHADMSVSYRRSGGAASLVAVRPIAITLRRENDVDVGEKSDGVTVEYQTGDDEFDAKVYVLTPTTDQRVLAAVLGPKVRRGVLELLRLGFHDVKIDDNGRVVATAGGVHYPRSGSGATAVDAFALVLSDLPAITASGGAHPAPPIWARDWVLYSLGIAGFLGLCAMPGSCGEELRDAPRGLSAFGISFLVAVGAALLARTLATPRLRGASDSSSRILGVIVTAFLVTLVATYFITLGLVFPALHR